MQRKQFHGKFLSMLLVAVLLLTLFPATPITAYAEAAHTAGDADALMLALRDVTDGGTVTLTASIDYSNAIAIYNKSIMLDLAGYTLTTTTGSGPGINISGNYTLTVQGSGTLNVTGTTRGIYASSGGEFVVSGDATVNATATDSSGIGAYADGVGSTVNVTGNATATGDSGVGARAANGGKITIDGSITAATYIRLGNTAKTQSQYTAQTTKEGYQTYTDDTSTVWVKSTVPGAPTIGTATAGNEQATVTFTAPANNGGATITGYTVTSNPGNITASGTTSPITVTGLTNGTAYTFTVTATNTFGAGVVSAASSSVTPATVPGAPTGVSATAGNGQATITFTAPANSGGAAITGYTVTSSGGQTATGTTSPITVTGLTNGTVYTFTVKATNSVGTGAASTASSSVTPTATVPGAPTGVSAIAGNGQATVTFTAPANNGGATITGYTVTSNPGNITANGTTSPITVTGLTNGTAYTFTVKATNSTGTGAASTASSSVTPVTVPGAPTGVSTAAGNGQATVTFIAPANNGGATITGYTVTSNPGNITATGTTSPITVTGLTNGTAYTFTVKATNSVGTGAASAASSSVTLPFAGTAAELKAVIANVDNDGTITLTDDITDYNEGIVISNIAIKKSFTLDLDGHTLTITNANAVGYGIGISDGYTLTIQGSGTLNVTGNTGIYAEDSGKFVVNDGAIVNATTSSNFGTGAYAYGSGSTVTVTGNATANGAYGKGAYAATGGMVNVTGDVTANGADGIGAYAETGGMVDVTGDVTGGSYGARAYDSGATVDVTGDVTAISDNGIGAQAISTGTITIDGSITATNYININGTPKTQSDHTTTSTNSGYLEYTDNSSYVFVKEVTLGAFVAVRNIVGVPQTATAGTGLTLTGTVVPGEATNKTIVWSVQSVGGTGATISGNTLNTTAAGTVTVRATIINGATESTNYTQNFDITVNPMPPTAVAWTTLTANGTANTTDTTQLTLTFDVDPTTLAVGDITVTGAAKGALSGTGTTRTLTISNITVAEGANVTVAIANPAGFEITPVSKTVAVHKALPALGGTASLTGTSAIGQTLTANTSLVTGGSGAFSYQWKSGGANVGTGAATYVLQGSDAGKAITCVITRADATGSVTATLAGGAVPYNITITSSGNVSGDTAVSLAAATGRAGNSIVLNYVLGNGSSDTTNTLTFTGGTGLVNLVAAGANTTQNYIVNASDANANGVIAITATFTHSNLTARTLNFANSSKTVTYSPGGTFTNAATASAGTGTITYGSTNTSVATVNSSGVVTIAGAGNATISAEITADGTHIPVSNSYALTVNNAEQSAPIGIGKTDETVTSANDGTITGVTTAMEYKLSTAGSYIAVTGTTITGLAPGTYNVRYAAKTNYNAGANATVTIAAGSGGGGGGGGGTPTPTPYTVTFDANGGSVSPAAVQTGSDGKVQTLPSPTRTGYSFDGWFTAATGGTQITTATVFSAATTVYAHWTTAIILTETPIPALGAADLIGTPQPGQSVTLPKTVDFGGGHQSDVTWKSGAAGDTGKATVGTDGKFTGTVEGTVTLTATSKTDKAKSITVKVTIAKNVTAVRSPVKALYLVKGKTLSPPVSFDGKDVKGKAWGYGQTAKLTYKSSNTSVATVNASGKITAKKTGTVKITATALNGKKVTITVKVVKKALKLKNVALTKPPKSLKVGKTAVLKVKLTPAKATGIKVTYKSSKPSVIKVDKSGKLYAVKKGTAKITVKAGGKTKVITVKVQ